MKKKVTLSTSRIFFGVMNAFKKFRFKFVGSNKVVFTLGGSLIPLLMSQCKQEQFQCI